MTGEPVGINCCREEVSGPDCWRHRHRHGIKCRYAECKTLEARMAESGVGRVLVWVLGEGAVSTYPLAG